MKNFIGTIDDFMNENDFVIENLILEKINQQLVFLEKINQQLVFNSDSYSNLIDTNKKLFDIKKSLKDFFFKEFGNWEIAMDFESFKNYLDYHFHSANKEIEEYFN